VCGKGFGVAGNGQSNRSVSPTAPTYDATQTLAEEFIHT
jgi:hypothetical protein